MSLKNTTYIYLRAITITVCLIIANQAFIQYWLYQKKGDAEVINLAGRQRMISQRLVNLNLPSHSGNTISNDSNEKIELYRNWSQVHQDLLDRHNTTGFSFISNEEIYKDLTAITPLIAKVKEFAESSHEAFDQIAFEAFRQNQDLFLIEMNKIVSKIEHQSRLKLTIVVWIELLFALFSLIMVYYEINFVFKKISQDLTVQNLKLKESNEMLEQYAYLAAHDLRSSVQNIINFSKELQESTEGKLDTDEHDYLQYVTDSAERMQETTASLLKFSTISQEKMVIRECNPRTILDNVINDLRAQIEQREANITYGEMVTSLQADKTLLHLVFLNLISNAIKFVSANKQPVVYITCQENPSHHVFMIQDNGIGIKHEDQQKIFRIFKRLNNQETYHGAGIGLSICQKIIAKHHGELSVESKPDVGSTFTFTIPKDQPKRIV